jgi:DNA-binding GntR family transcriptional regulator
MIRQVKRAPAMSQAVVDELRRAILTGKLRPGTRIRQQELAALLNVSRAPVRQALVNLEREGLVIPAPNGRMVAPLDRRMILDLYAFRDLIDAYVASTLAARQDFDIRPHRRIIDAGRRAADGGDVSGLIELDLEFHTSLYDAVQNRVLSEVMRGQWTHIRRVMVAVVVIRGFPHQVWTEHAAIVDAIANHDPDEAGRRAVAHTRAACDVLMANLFPADQPGQPAVGPQRITAPRRRRRAARAHSSRSLAGGER